MLNKDKNPEDIATIKDCESKIEEIHDRLISNGVSKREITVVKMKKIIDDLNHLEKMVKKK